MKLKKYVIMVLFLITVSLGCPFTGTKPPVPEPPGDQLIVNGVVVYHDNTPVPDSIKCTVSYFDEKTNKNIIKLVRYGKFSLFNLADGEYKIVATTGAGDSDGSITFTVKNQKLVGSKDKNYILRIVLGLIDIPAKPIPPVFIEPDTKPGSGAGRIIENP